MKLSRRGFSLACLGVAGAQSACRAPAIESSKAVLVDLREIAAGSSRTVACGFRQIVVRHLTTAETALVRAWECDGCSRPEWIVLEARCTHLGCNLIEGAGRFGGWLCPCHGSEFDVSGRVTRGPAEANLPVPPHRFVDDHTLLLLACQAVI